MFPMSALKTKQHLIEGTKVFSPKEVEKVKKKQQKRNEKESWVSSRTAAAISPSEVNEWLWIFSSNRVWDQKTKLKNRGESYCKWADWLGLDYKTKFTRVIIMSTGLTLLGFILYNIFLTCSNVGLWAGLFFLHLLINCSRERKWEKQTAFCHSKHRQCFKLILVFSWCKLSIVKPYLQLVKSGRAALRCPDFCRFMLNEGC